MYTRGRIKVYLKTVWSTKPDRFFLLITFEEMTNFLHMLPVESLPVMLQFSKASNSCAQN